MLLNIDIHLQIWGCSIGGVILSGVCVSEGVFLEVECPVEGVALKTSICSFYPGDLNTGYRSVCTLSAYVTDSSPPAFTFNDPKP